MPPEDRGRWPQFLDDLDSDRARTGSAFHWYAWNLLRERAPWIFRDFPLEDRDDLIADVVKRWRENDQARLRRHMPGRCRFEPG